jgi:type I site-specific restriction endonuclease
LFVLTSFGRSGGERRDNHERAVADGVNVGYEVYRIKTQVTEQGGQIEKGD